MSCRLAILVFGTASIFLTNVEARGDAGPIPRFNVDVHLIFENLDEFPDHDFYLRYWPNWGPSKRDGHLIKLQSNTPAKIDWFRSSISSPIHLVAVAKGVPLVLPKNPDPEKQRLPLPGTLQSQRLAADPDGGTLRGGFFREEITYRVRLTNDSLHADCVSASRPELRIGSLVCGGACIFVLGIAAMVLVMRKIARARSS